MAPWAEIHLPLDREKTLKLHCQIAALALRYAGDLVTVHAEFFDENPA